MAQGCQLPHEPTRSLSTCAYPHYLADQLVVIYGPKILLLFASCLIKSGQAVETMKGSENEATSSSGFVAAKKVGGRTSVRRESGRTSGIVVPFELYFRVRESELRLSMQFLVAGGRWLSPDRKGGARINGVRSFALDKFGCVEDRDVKCQMSEARWGKLLSLLPSVLVLANQC